VLLPILRRQAPAVERAFVPAPTIQALLQRHALYESRWAGRWHGGRPGLHPPLGGLAPKPGVHPGPGYPGWWVEGEALKGGSGRWDTSGIPAMCTRLVRQVFGAGRRYYWAMGSGLSARGSFILRSLLTAWLRRRRTLNRTLVLDPEVCLNPLHNGQRTLINPLAAYYDLPAFLA